MLTMAVLALIVPAVLAAGIVGLGRVAVGRGGGWWGASAVGLAYLAGHAAVARPAVPPAEVTDGIPWLALAAAALAVFEAARPAGAAVRGAGRSLLAALTLGMILGPIVSGGELPKETVVWLSVSAAVALAAWVNLEALAARPGGELNAFRGVLITAGGAGVVLMVSGGSAVLGLLGVALTSALVGGWFAARGNPPPGHFPVAAAVLTALVLEGYVYASLPISEALLLAAAPTAAWVTRVGPVRRTGPWASATLGAVAVMIPVGVAIGLAVYSSLGNEY